MPQVMVNIGGKPYRLACNPGDEERLGSLAKYLDDKIAEIQGGFRDLGDQRIVVMAALSIADELFDARRRGAGAATDKAEAVAREAEARASAQARVALLEQAIADVTARVEALTDTLNAAGPSAG